MKFNRQNSNNNDKMKYDINGGQEMRDSCMDIKEVRITSMVCSVRTMFVACSAMIIFVACSEQSGENTRNLLQPRTITKKSKMELRKESRNRIKNMIRN